jgi:hypothetical protein
MADFHVRKGDRLPAIEAQLFRDDGVVNLTGVTSVELRWRPVAGGTVVVKSATVTDAAAGKVKYEWGVGDTDTAGVYAALWRVTFADGRKASYPNQGFFRFAVTDDL